MQSPQLSFYMKLAEQGKTVSAAIRYLYIYLFGTTNAKMAFLHKNAEGSKDNLQTLKDIRDCLPPYLQMKERPLGDGKVDKGRDSVTMITNPFNNNNIKTFASATNKAKAASLLRGRLLSFAPYYSNIVRKILLNCWERLKLSYLHISAMYV